MSMDQGGRSKRQEGPRFALYLLSRSPLATGGAIILIVNLLMAFLAPMISPFDPIKQDLNLRLLPPGGSHILGTDQLGRDIASRIIWGSRISFEIGLIVVALSFFLGVPLGLVSGYAGGKVDELIMRITDIFLAFPALVLAIFIEAVIGPGLVNAIFSIAIVSWPTYARLARGSTLALKEREFIEAARAADEGTRSILFRHILPNILSPTTVQATLDMGNAVLTAAALSFIGLGVQPPTPEWGQMVATGRDFISFAWWMSAFPGFAILAFVMGFNLIGDWLNDLLNPAMKQLG